MNHFTVGQRVRIERDEKLHPSQGTWPRYRGKPGIVVSARPDEIGVDVGAVTARRNANGDVQNSGLTWFRPHELRSTG